MTPRLETLYGLIGAAFLCWLAVEAFYKLITEGFVL